MELPSLLPLLERSLQGRLPELEAGHSSALRLFNGFTEGLPDLTVDLYGRSLLISNLANSPRDLAHLIQPVVDYYRQALPFVQASLLKMRHGGDWAERRGVLLHGETLDERIIENGTWYALDLRLNQDAGFYLDTRNLRAWLKENLDGKTVLNTFAYTGSLGIAALAGGAASVLQTDLNPRFLELAQRSASLNPAISGQHRLQSGDFFRIIGGLRHQGRQFDCVILDAPFFSKTEGGKVDLVSQFSRLINKVRPLVAHNGWLAAVNNALFLSGEDLQASLNALCADGYMEIETILPVPADIAGYTNSFSTSFPADPAPYNHPTKITILRVQRRDQTSTSSQLK